MKKRQIALGILATLPLMTGTVAAYETGDWVLRAGAATVDPREDSDLGLGLNSNTQLGLTATYMVTDRIGVGILAATPFQHDVSLGGAVIAEVEHLPPTVSAQYFFMDPSSAIQPYAGLGVNYTWTMDEDLTATGTGAGLSNLDVDDSIGLAAEVGVDYQITDKVVLNAAVWYIDLQLDVSVDAGAATLTDELEVDPFVYMVGVGYKF